MTLTQSEAADVGRRVLEVWPDQTRNDRIHRYVTGDHDMPFAPRRERAFYKWMLERSRTNWCRLLVSLMVQNLYVDGYRTTTSGEPQSAAGWAHWQRNRMDRKQTAVHRAAVKYGRAFVLVTPGTLGPVIAGVSPREMSVVYAEPGDEWPLYALHRITSWSPGGRRTLYRLYDDRAVYYLERDNQGGLSYIEHREHNLGVCPVVQFVDEDDLEGDSPGVVAPFIPVQDRLNLSTFQLLMTGQHGAHRQRWAAGLELDEDEEPPIGPDRLLHSDSSETRFGSFEATSLSGYVEVLEQVLRHLAALTQTPPHSLHGSLVNIAADALEAAEEGFQRRVGERRTSFGESWEQVLRLCSFATGDVDGWADLTAQVRWKDTKIRSLSAVVDAWGKAVQMLGIPARATWERLPGVTQTDVQQWETMPVTPDGHALLADVLGRATAPEPPVTPATETTFGG